MHRISSVLAGSLLLGMGESGFAQPSLRIETPSEAQLRLSWPAAAADFELEQSPTLGPGAAWSAVQPGPALMDDRFTVTVSPLNTPRFYRLKQVTTGPELVSVVSSSPAPGEEGVSVNRETILRLSGPLAESALLSPDDFQATFGGRPLLTRAERSPDRRTLTLFYLEPLPANALITVTLEGSRLQDTAGRPIDPDGEGPSSTTYSLQFRTASISGLPTTGVEGRVLASEKAANGSDRPLANVIVTVDGAEETLRTTTDANGFFRLIPAPAGRFFVHVDGRTASGSQWPGGAYYPFVGKAWEAVAGRTNNLAGGNGLIYLPLIQSDTLQPVSPVTETRITFSPSVLAANPELAGVEVAVPPNALFHENGARGGRLGIAPVPPDRLPEPLPPGLNLPLVITIQTDGPQNFDQPVPVRFPNLPDPVTGVPLPPGTKTMLWSFNHDTGRWEAQGTATISADGRFAVTDPGVGVRQPGWHGVSPGIALAGPPRPPLPSECTGDDCPDCVQTVFCNVPLKEGQHYALCALKCLGDVVDEIFGDRNGNPKPPRTSFETGLRCIGGPDTCPQKPEDSLSPERRDCMDKCRFPDSARRVFVVPCEGFFDPCERPALHGPSSRDPDLHATASLLPDRFEEQLRFWEVEGEFLTRLAGTPKIIENSLADVPKVTRFFDEFAVRVRPASPSGIHLSPEERAQLLALPRPSQFSATEWAALIDRLDTLQGAAVPADVAAADTALTQLVDELKRRGWRYRLDGLIHGHLRLSRARAPQFNSPDFPARPHYFLLKHHQTGFVQRGRLTPTGEFQGLVLAPSGFYTILYLDPLTRRTGGAFFQTGDTGSASVIPTAPFEDLPASEPDTDGDGLPDFSEEIVGTHPGQADSDGDGIPDGEEVASGTNALDGAPQALGTLAVADTPGTAVDVVAWNDLAAVADTDAGVTLFEVSNPFSPVRLAQHDTPGRAVAVAGAGTLLAVADDAEGVTLLDVADPARPLLRARTRFSRQARAVTQLDGSVIAGLASGELVVLDPSGAERSRIAGDNKAVQDVVAVNGFLYSLKVGSLEVFTFDGTDLSRTGGFEAAGTAGTGGRRWRLADGGNRLYVTQARGFHVFDLASPLSPILLQSFNTAQFGWKQIVPDGAGLGLAAVGTNSSDDGAHDVSLYALGASGTGTNLVATLTTPGLAAAVSLWRGAALVADGASGLSVVNPRGREIGSVPPTVSLALRLQQGAQSVEVGVPFTVIANATDDERVSHVEFHLNDTRVAIDGQFPFEAVLSAPATASGPSPFVLRARAVDTAGHATWSTPLEIQPGLDQSSPRVLALRPETTERFASGTPLTVSALFNEALRMEGLSEGFRLINLGEDRIAGTPDDTVVPSPVEGIGPNHYRLALPGPLAVGSYQAQLGTQITDQAGNPLAAEVTWNFEVLPLGEFVGTSSLLWNAQADTSNNWSFARLPTLDDHVRIAAPNGGTVRVVGQVQAYDLRTTTPLGFDPSSSLRLSRSAVFEGPLSLGRNASWRGGSVVFRSTTQLLGAFTLADQEWVNEGLFQMAADASLSLRNTARIQTSIRNASGATWNMTDSQIALPTSSAGPVDFLNEGRMVNRGSTRSHFAPTRFVNLGSVEVLSGVLDIVSGNLNTGPSQHLGAYHVETGATLEFTGLGDFGRGSRLTGGGTVQFGASPVAFRGSLETSGAILVPGTVTFSGDVRTTGPWNTKGGHALFTGLNPRLTGSVVSEGALTVAALPRLQAGDLAVYRDLTLNTELQVDGTLRLDSTETPSGSIAAARLLGPGRLRALGPVVFTGILNSGGTGILEILGTARGEGRTVIQFNPNGYALVVKSGGSLDLSGIERLTARGGLTNEGTLLKADASVTEVTRTLHNRGNLLLTQGTLLVANGQYLQSAGSLTLSGGSLTVQPTATSAADTTAVLMGGQLEGQGVLTSSSVTNSARIAPGTTGSPVGVLDLQVGDHPTESSLHQTAEGTLAIDVRGPNPGEGHDQLKVSGRAVLNGTLELAPAPGFDPPLGQEFTFLTAQACEGTFAQVTGTGLPGGKRFEVIYGPTTVKLRVRGP